MNSVRQIVKTAAERKEAVRSIVKPLTTAKRDRTLVRMYNRIQPGPDGRIHTRLGVGTTTSRLASSGDDSEYTEEEWTNLQNIANKVAALDPLYRVRDVLKASDGMVLVALDYSGAEGLLAFAYSKDWEWVDKCLAGADIHREHASHFFGNISLDEVTGKQRKTAKNVTYASFYSATVRTITVTINRDTPIHGLRVTQDEVAGHRKTLLQLHPLEQWWSDVDEELERNGGYVYNCFGYRRPLRDPDRHNRLKDALSTLPQSTVACCMNYSVPRVLAEVEEPGEVELIHQVHDELVLQARLDRVDDTISRVSAIMEEPFEIHGRELHIPTEAKVGERWGQMEKVEEAA